MSIVFLLFSCIFFYTRSEILTHEDIYGELKSFQEQQIGSQKKYFELHRHDSFITIGFDGAEDTLIEQLNNNIINLLARYLEVTKNCDMKLISKISSDYFNYLSKSEILEFFQNAYIFNHCITNKQSTYEQIFEQYKYKINHSVKNIDDIKMIVNLHSMSRKKNLIDNSKVNFWFPKKSNDFMLITNCMNAMENYELFYNECIKYGKLYYGKTSLVFIALKLDEKEKQDFNNFDMWNHLININNMTNMVLEYEALYLQKRTPCGEFLAKKNKDYVLGWKIVKKHGEKKNMTHEICYKTKINQHFGFQRVFVSMQSIIACSEVQNNQNESFKAYNPDFCETENLQLNVVTISYADAVFNLSIYYTKKLIEDIGIEKKKTFVINVYICIDQGYCPHMILEYAYYMKSINENSSYSFLHNNEVISDILIQQHLSAYKMIANLKSCLSKSLMHYDTYFHIAEIISHDNFYVIYNKKLTSNAILVTWNHLDTRKSIVYMLSKLKTYFDIEATFFLYKYTLYNQNYFNQIDDKRIYMFFNVYDLTRFTEITDEFEFDEIQEKQNYCLQICLFEHGFTQYYYLFLPTYEFQLFNYDLDINEVLLLFCELLEESKINYKSKMNPEVSVLYNSVIDGIKRLKNIPKSVILCYLSNHIDHKIDFFIYEVIAKMGKNHKNLINVYNTLDSYEEWIHNFDDISHTYNDIYLSSKRLYLKFTTNLFVKTMHSLVSRTIMECFQRIAKLLSSKIYDKPKQICYLQCGNDFPALNAKSIFSKLILGKIKL